MKTGRIEARAVSHDGRKMSATKKAVISQPAAIQAITRSMNVAIPDWDESMWRPPTMPHPPPPLVSCSVIWSTIAKIKPIAKIKFSAATR